MTGERDELPEGWKIYRLPSGLVVLESPDTKPSFFGSPSSNAHLVAAAWRIVDAERDAADGR